MPYRAEMLQGAPTSYAPENELGVVYLFCSIAKKLQLRIERIQSGFPDCVAYKRIGGREKRIRIEFEFRSSNFRLHGHSARCCDWIVCWEHDWPEIPASLRVVELRKRFSSTFKIWILPARKDQWHGLEDELTDWGVPKRASRGDLLLMYRCSPATRIEDIFTVAGDKEAADPSWREGKCYLADIRRLCRMAVPITLDDMRQDRNLRRASFIRMNMQGNHHVTEYWPYLHEMILERNPRLGRQLARFSPDHV